MRRLGSRRLGWWLGLLAITALAAALRAPLASLPLERDEGEYAYIGWRWLDGEVPYRDSFDQKGPATFAVYAGVLALFGGSPSRIHWGLQVYQLATLLLLAAVGARLFSRRVGIGAGLLAALIVASPGLYGNATNAEGLALLPLVAGVLAALRGASSGSRGSCLVAGACGGAALLFKPVVAPLLLFQLGLLAFGVGAPPREQLRRAGLFAAGAAPVLAAAVGYFALQGAFGALLDALVFFNLGYATTMPLERYPVAFRRQTAAMLPTLWPVLALLLLGVALRLARLAGSAAEPAARARSWRCGWAWLACAALAVSAGGYFRPHYFQLAAPPLALLAAASVEEAARRAGLRARGRAVALAVVTAAVLLQAVAAAPWYFLPGSDATRMQRLYTTNPFQEAVLLGRFLGARADPEDRVFVFGSEPQILFYARRRSASRYIFLYPLMLGDAAEARRRQGEVIDALRERPPRFIVGVFERSSLLEHRNTPTDLRLALARLVRERYRPVAMLPRGSDAEADFVTKPEALELWQDGRIFQRKGPRLPILVWERRGEREPRGS